MDVQSLTAVGLKRKLALDVAQVSRPADLAASTRPKAACGSADPHDSRPRGRRYLLADKLLAVRAVEQVADGFSARFVGFRLGLALFGA